MTDESGELPDTERAAHPWNNFLDARARVINWLITDYHWTDAQIAKQLSIGATQVLRIRASNHGSGCNGKADADVTRAAPLGD